MTTKRMAKLGQVLTINEVASRPRRGTLRGCVYVLAFGMVSTPGLARAGDPQSDSITFYPSTGVSLGIADEGGVLSATFKTGELWKKGLVVETKLSASIDNGLAPLIKDGRPSSGLKLGLSLSYESAKAREGQSGAAASSSTDHGSATRTTTAAMGRADHRSAQLDSVLSEKWVALDAWDEAGESAELEMYRLAELAKTPECAARGDCEAYVAQYLAEAAQFDQQQVALHTLPSGPRQSWSWRAGFDIVAEYAPRDVIRAGSETVEVTDENGVPVTETRADGTTYTKRKFAESELQSEGTITLGGNAALFLGNHVALDLRGGIDVARASEARELELCETSQFDDPNLSAGDCKKSHVVTEDPSWSASGYLQGGVQVLMFRKAFKGKSKDEEISFTPGLEVRAGFEGLGQETVAKVRGAVFMTPGFDAAHARVGLGAEYRTNVGSESNAEDEVVPFAFLGAVF